MATALQFTLPSGLPIVVHSHGCGWAEATPGAVIRYQVRKYYRDLATSSEGRDQHTYLLEPFQAA